LDELANERLPARVDRRLTAEPIRSGRHASGREHHDGAPRLEEVVGDAWRDAWKEHFRPFAITRSIVIRPPWESYAEKPGEQVLVLEPGRAFGTGLHETTSLVARVLEARRGELVGKTVLDVGCGSGILALVALFLTRHHFDSHKLSGQIAFGLIFGGIAGNLTDRLLPSRHAVVDFIYFYIQQRGGNEIGFPAFNIADSAICTGVGLIFLITWKNEHAPKQSAN